MKEWRTTKMRLTLWRDIEHVIVNAKVRNTPKYDSVADFVEKACFMLLNKEKEKEVLAT